MKILQLEWLLHNDICAQLFSLFIVATLLFVSSVLMMSEAATCEMDVSARIKAGEVDLDSEGGARNVYSIHALPTTYLIGRDGKISGLIMGERDWSKAAPALLDMMQGDIKDTVE